MSKFETIFQTCYFIYSFLKRTKFLTPCGLSYSVRHFSSHDHHPAPFPTPVAPPPPPPPVFRTTGQGCPVIPPKTPYECTGQASTCWSPGVRDTDCPGHGLCCFNGCVNICHAGEARWRIMFNKTFTVAHPLSFLRAVKNSYSTFSQVKVQCCMDLQSMISLCMCFTYNHSVLLYLKSKWLLKLAGGSASYTRHVEQTITEVILSSKRLFMTSFFVQANSSCTKGPL